MHTIVGSAAPMMPMTGHFNSRHEPRRWAEGNLENWNAYFTLRGTGEVAFARETIRTTAGDLLLLAPSFKRNYSIPDPARGWEFYWLHFRATPRMTHCLDWFDRARPWQIHRVTDIPMRSAVTAQIEDLHRLNLTEPDLPGREPIVEAMLEAALLRVAAAGHRASSPRTVDARIERALEHFHCDIAAPNDVDTMARRAGLSRSQFCLLFRRGTGSAPQAYIEERRLDMAAFHLRTTAKSVGEISGLVGFSNPFYFTNRFSRRFGSSPSAYRANRRGAGLHHGFVSENIPTAGQIV